MRFVNAKDQNDIRKQRIMKMAEEKLALSVMPKRMQADLENRAKLPPKPAYSDKNCTFKPKIDKMADVEQYKANIEKR